MNRGKGDRAAKTQINTVGRSSVSVCLVGLALALLLVGVISGTVLRHVVQVVPILLALGLLQRHTPLGAYAALPIFLFWSAIVILIWLFLLGVSRIANGRYTTVEIALTVVMAVCCVAGGIASVSTGRPLRVFNRLAVFLLFAVAQIGAMWVSFLPSIANR